MKDTYLQFYALSSLKKVFNINSLDFSKVSKLKEKKPLKVMYRARIKVLTA